MSGLNVLAVDDSALQRNLLQAAFEQAGHHVAVARNGAEALLLCAEARFDAVVSDCQMPILDGYQLCRLLKDDAKTKAMPVLLMTGSMTRLSRFWARTCGADRFWVKSSDFSGLVRSLESLTPPPDPGPGHTGGAAPRLSMDEVRFEAIQSRLSQALERRMLDISLRNAISALGANIHEPAAVAWGFLRLMEELVAPGVLYAVLPTPQGDLGFLLHSPGVPAQKVVEVGGILRSRHQDTVSRWDEQASLQEGGDAGNLVLQDFEVRLAGHPKRGWWGVCMDEGAYRAHLDLFELAHEEYTRLFNTMVMLSLLLDANEQLMKADDAKTEFVNTLSHELRSPLTATRGSLGLVLGGVAGPLPDKATELLQVSQRNLERTLRLINGVLDLEKIQAGQFRLDLSPVDLVEMAQESLHGIAGMALDRGVALSFADLPPGEWRVLGDMDRLIQCLTNLLSNAIKFSPEKGRVMVALSRETSGLRVSVSDQGPGIPESFRPRIFGKFQQAAHKQGGTGLGLAITRKLVEAMGGRVGFESTEGKGTTFHMEFPVPQR